MIRLVILTAAVVLFGLSFSGAVQAGTKVVHFDSAAFPGGDANPAEQGPGTPIWGHLGQPEKAGSYPAVILMHGCGGIQQSNMDWAKLLNEAGYVTLLVDSYRPRSLIQRCDGVGGSASANGRVLDAIGALNYLKRQPFVDGGRIAVMGWSAGGVTSLALSASSGLSQRLGFPFKASIAFYPYCIADRKIEGPALVLIGARDDWTPAKDCTALQARNQNSLDLEVFPSAFHAFDNKSLGSGFQIPGAFGNVHWLEYDEKAHTTSIERVKAFLDKHL